MKTIDYLSQPELLSKEYIVKELSEIDTVSIEESDDRGLIVWDDEDAKNIPFHFIEKMSPANLANMIYISPDIPERYQIDKKALAEYLWNSCDKNSFITLDNLVVIWSKPEDDKFVDAGSEYLYNGYGDEYALEICKDLLGQLWFERNTVVINMGEIVRASEEITKENEDIVDIDPFFSLENQVLTGLLTTVIHELRHLQLDTNIVLPEDKYPISLASEERVESYCREVFENNYADPKIIPSLFRDEKLSEDKMNIRYRTENFSGSMVRDAASVMAFETFELGNIDILEYLRDNFLKDLALIEKVSAFIAEINENGYVDDFSDDDRNQFFYELLDEVEKETGVPVKYALWLTDLDSLTDKEHFYGKYVEYPEDIDSYEVGPIILSELDCDGTLYGYTDLPQCLEEKIEVLKRDLFDVINKKEGDSLTIQEKVELDELCSELESNIQKIEEVFKNKNLVFSQSRENENSLSDNTSSQKNTTNLDDKLQKAQARVQVSQSASSIKTNERLSER